MADRPIDPAGLGSDQANCAACRRLHPTDELDDRLWCPECVEALQRRMRRGRHLTGLAFTAPFALWVALESSFEVLSVYAWLLPLAAAYYLGYRVGGELVKGYVRWSRARAPAASETRIQGEETDGTA